MQFLTLSSLLYVYVYVSGVVSIDRMRMVFLGTGTWLLGSFSGSNLAVKFGTAVGPPGRGIIIY